MDLADKQNYQPIGSPFVGEIDHNEITYLEVYIKCLFLVHIIPIKIECYFNIQ